MNTKLDELTKGPAQSATQRAALQKFTLGLALGCAALMLTIDPTGATDLERAGRAEVGPANKERTTSSHRVPFHGIVFGSGSVPTLPHVENSGIANHLGAFTGSAEFYPDLSDLAFIPYTGTFDWFAANGDEIYGTFEGYMTDEDMDFVYDNREIATVTGGTGRFAGATGTVYLGGLSDFTTFPDFSFALPWDGWISTVGSNKKP